jgi:hypothetical protein
MINLHNLGPTGSELAQCIWDCENADQLDVLCSTLDRQEAAWALWMIHAIQAGGDDVSDLASAKKIIDIIGKR